MEIMLAKDVEKRLTTSIKRYVAENLDIDIGDLQSSLFLQFCREEIGPSIYNQAISDAQAYMQDKALDMENNCFAPESTYWIKQDKKLMQHRIRRNKTYYRKPAGHVLTGSKQDTTHEPTVDNLRKLT
jgi:uncharacterized protein (DUF2164 family)